MIFSKIGKLFLKFSFALLGISLAISLLNIFPFYLNMVRVADDLLMRATINNYILSSQVNDSVREGFINSSVFNQLTYKGKGNNGLVIDGKPSGVYVSMVVGHMPSNPDWNNQGTRKVILNEPATFDPKTNPADAVKLDKVYHAAQRGDEISVRLDAKIKCNAIFAGINIPFEIPLTVTRSAPAMYYYRNFSS